MGWSNGGGVPMQFAADYPQRVQRLILLASISTRGYAAVNAEGVRLQTKEQIENDPRLAMTLQANQRPNRDYFDQAMGFLMFSQSAAKDQTLKVCLV
ncbi:hypothetical protein OHJ21_07770 [Virgibacillus sp. LDC1]|nr:hypothetical protein [Paenibacillus sp. GM2FR]MCV4231067.1 hypothetical protein [Virgibacillus sp. LDC1]